MCDHSANKKIIKAEVLRNESIVEDIYEMTLNAPEISSEAVPGQFINMYCESSERLLPRPISISTLNPDEGSITVIYAVTGLGTREFASCKPGGSINILGPLGTGFSINEQHHKSIIVAGGVGTPPMVGLAQALSGEVTIFLGFRSNPYLIEKLSDYGDVYVATDDGSCGIKGNVVDLLNNEKPSADMLYSCGPKPMLMAVQKWSAENGIAAQLSLEERMGCGIGTCVGCVVKIKNNSEQGWEYRKVCKDGPVFNSREVLF